MRQVLIIENSTNKLEPIKESSKAADGTKDYVLGGIFTEFDIKNRNERIYTADKFLPHLQELKERINNNPGVVYGEFDHPDSFDISLSRISHVITNAEFVKEENLVRGEIKLLGTKYGKEAKAIIDDGFPIFVSSRAAGVTESNGVVNLKKLFTYDAVADPGFGSAKMEMKGSLNESLGFNNNTNFRIFDLSNDIKTNELFEMNSNDMVTKDQLVEYSKYLTGELEKLQAKLESFATGKEGAPDFAKMQKMITEYESMQMVQEKLVGYVNYLSDHLKHVLIENKSLKEQQSKIIEHSNYLADEISENFKTSEMLAEHVYDSKKLLNTINEDVTDLKDYSNYLSEHLTNTIEYAEYITENLDNSIAFSDYLADNLDASIAFSDYLAENVDANINMSNYLADHIETTIEYAEYITENVSDNIEYLDYIAENLDNNIGHSTYITEKLNKKFGTSKLITESSHKEMSSDISDAEAEAIISKFLETIKDLEGMELTNTIKTFIEENPDFKNRKVLSNSDVANALDSMPEPENVKEDVNNKETEDDRDEDYFMSPDEFNGTMNIDSTDMEETEETEETEEDEEETLTCTRDEEGNLIPAEEETGIEGNEEGTEEEEDGKSGVEEIPVEDTVAAEEETEEEMMDTDPMLSGISAGKTVKIEGTVDTAKVISVSDEGVIIEMTSTGEQVLKQPNEIVPLNDDGTKTSLTDNVKSLIEEAKKREASKDEEPHFFTFLSESQKANFKELSQDDQERIKVTINESDGYFCQADVLKIMHKALAVETETLEEKLVKYMPEDVKPIWEQLDTKAKNGVFAQARIHNLNTADLIEHFWRTRPQLKDNTNMVSESKKTIDTDIIDNSLLDEDVINMFKNKFENLK